MEEIKVKYSAAKSAVIGFYRSGATCEQINKLTGIGEDAINFFIQEYCKIKNELPTVHFKPK